MKTNSQPKYHFSFLRSSSIFKLWVLLNINSILNRFARVHYHVRFKILILNPKNLTLDFFYTVGKYSSFIMKKIATRCRLNLESILFCFYWPISAKVCSMRAIIINISNFYIPPSNLLKFSHYFLSWCQNWH